MRIVSINGLVFLAILAVIEIFFSVNAKMGFLSNSQISRWREEKKVTFHTPKLSRAEAEKIYGSDILRIPEGYSAEKDYEWTFGNLHVPAENMYVSYPPDYFKDRYARKFAKKAYPVHKDFVFENKKNEIYSVEYYFDEHGFRKTKKIESFTAPTVLALGDSFTFGEGVKQGNDYPSQLQAKLKSEWNVLNLGFHGYGINDLFYELQKYPDRLSFLKNQKVIAIWLFIPAHLERLLCHTECVRSGSYGHIHGKPRYFLKDSSIQFDNFFDESVSPDRLLVNFLAKSQTLKFFQFDYPANYSKEELVLFAKIMDGIRAEISKNAVVQDVYLVTAEDFDQKNELFAELRKAGIKVLDYANIDYVGISKRMSIPLDGHPTSEFYWVLTELLKKDIFQKLKNDEKL